VFRLLLPIEEQLAIPKNNHMAIEYRIALHARTTSGFETIGEFFFGSDRQAANELFKTLKGSADQIEDGILLMELREINRDLPFDIQLIHCTLDQVADNCRLITKNHFKTLNLKEL
jgi:hypothetical protein